MKIGCDAKKEKGRKMVSHVYEAIMEKESKDGRPNSRLPSDGSKHHHIDDSLKVWAGPVVERRRQLPLSGRGKKREEK